MGSGAVPVPGPKYANEPARVPPAAVLAIRLACASLNSSRKPLPAQLISFQSSVAGPSTSRVPTYRTSTAILLLIWRWSPNENERENGVLKFGSYRLTPLLKSIAIG